MMQAGYKMTKKTPIMMKTARVAVQMRQHVVFPPSVIWRSSAMERYRTPASCSP